MPDSKNPGNDCYSAGERGWMERGQRARGFILQPFLALATAFHIRPDHLTVLSVLAGAGFAVAWMTGHPVLALLALFLHVILDGLDGPVARYQSVASPRGSFTDTFCDQIVLTTVTICLMVGTPTLLGVVPGALYLVLYHVVVAMAMVRNSLGIPYIWLFRPRFVLFAAIPLSLWWIGWLVEAVVWLSNGLLLFFAATGFVQLRRMLRGPSAESH